MGTIDRREGVRKQAIWEGRRRRRRFAVLFSGIERPEKWPSTSGGELKDAGKPKRGIGLWP
jgi:hypothetical protein